MMINGVHIACVGGNVSEAEAWKYVEYIEKKKGGRPCSVVIDIEGGENVCLQWTIRHRGFERIRRITGYLVGTVDRWNNAKKSEERDRVKHG